MLVGVRRICEEDGGSQRGMGLCRSGRERRVDPARRRKDGDVVGRVEPSAVEVVEEVLDLPGSDVEGS